MTDHDFRLEDKTAAPNYAIRRVKFALAVIGFVVSCTLLFVAERPASAPGLWLVAGVYLLTGLWLTVRFTPQDETPDDSYPIGGGTTDSRDN